MKIMTWLIILAVVGTVGCGGSSSNNPPHVSGNYACTSSCLDICKFSTLTITQTGTTVLAVAPLTSCTGDVTDNGDYSAECKGSSLAADGSCNGTFVGGTFTADCSFGGATCQRVIFTRQ